MRAVVQRVKQAAVHIGDTEHARIRMGLLVLLGVEVGDTPADAEWLCGKIARLRIFADTDGVMNLDITQVHGELLLVSQFTLHASTKKGNRPSYIRAAGPEQAAPLYDSFIERTEELLGRSVCTGVFRAMMEVSLINDGPVTILIDSRNRE